MRYPVKAINGRLLHLSDLEDPILTADATTLCNRHLVSAWVYDEGIVGYRRCYRCGTDADYDRVNATLALLAAERKAARDGHYETWVQMEANRQESRKHIAQRLENLLGRGLADEINPAIGLTTELFAAGVEITFTLQEGDFRHKITVKL